MNWNDKGIVVATRKFSENSLIAQILTESQGLHAGVVKYASSKSTRGNYQLGNLVFVTWKARLAEHLGVFNSELLEAASPLFLHDQPRLSCLVSACAMIEATLPEREVHKEVFKYMESLMESLKSDSNWKENYVYLEMELLKRLGFGMDLSSCAATGKTESLRYVSPRSGRAVSSEAGAEYIDKLLSLPDFIAKRLELCEKDSEILEGLRLTGYFLSKHIFAEKGRSLPPARQRFVEMMQNTVKV